MRSYLRALVQDYHDHSEIMQNTFITAWEKFSQFEGDENDFCKWACVIARYQALKHRQTQARDKLVLSEKVLEKIASEGIEDPTFSNVPLGETLWATIQEALVQPRSKLTTVKNTYPLPGTIQTTNRPWGFSTSSRKVQTVELGPHLVLNRLVPR